MSRLLSFSPIQRHLKHSSTRAAHTCRLPTFFPIHKHPTAKNTIITPPISPKQRP